MERFKKHVFICTNDLKDPSCGRQGGNDLHAKLKEEALAKYGGDIRINKSGCLGACKKGICAVVYPEGKWFYELDKDDNTKIMDYLKVTMEGE